MGYAHIVNLYRPDGQTILLFRECWALEKVHGTSAHVSFVRSGAGGIAVSFSPGAESAERFRALFDADKLLSAFDLLGLDSAVVYGEAYGGRRHGQSWRYGKELRFVTFDVLVGDLWLAVPDAHRLAAGLGFEFVPYVKTSTDLSALDAQRDAPSVVAALCGMGEQRREGVVLRPLVEVRTNDGQRVCAKHKREEERETKTPRQVVSAERLAVLSDAQAIADEWVTEMRLTHVLDRVAAAKAGTTLRNAPVGMEDAGKVIAVMVEDVLREGSGELVDSREARAAIGRQTALLLRRRLRLHAS